MLRGCRCSCGKHWGSLVQRSLRHYMGLGSRFKMPQEDPSESPLTMKPNKVWREEYAADAVMWYLQNYS